MSISAYGDYRKYKTGNLDNSRPLVQYLTVDGKDNFLDTTNRKGGMQPLINWGKVSTKAKDALTKADFKNGNDMSMKYSVFKNMLEKACLNGV